MISSWLICKFGTEKYLLQKLLKSNFQVTKMTPAPSVVIVVSIFLSPATWDCFDIFIFSFLQECGPVNSLSLFSDLPDANHIHDQAFMSCCYLCSSNIFAMINYVGFATWVSLNTSCKTRSFFIILSFSPALHWPGCLLLALPPMEAPRVGKADQGGVW